MEICDKLLVDYITSFEIRQRAVVINERASSPLRMQACSACAGEYEDPDRTAGDDFEELLAGDDEYEWQGDEEECEGLDRFDVDFDE